MSAFVEGPERTGSILWRWLDFRKRGSIQGQLPPNLTYGAEDKPPLLLSALAGFQWVGLINVYLVYLLVIALETNLSPSVTASMIAVSMIALGVAALLQALPRGPIGSGYFCPAVLSANYLGPSIAAIKLGGLSMMFGMTMFAGLVQMVIAPIIARRRDLMPLEISGLVVMLIGVTVGLIGVKYSFGIDDQAGAVVTNDNLIVVGVTLGLTVVCTIWGKGSVKMLSPLIGLIGGYIASAVFGMLSLADLPVADGVPVFAFPSFEHVSFSFDLDLALPFAIAAMASAAKSLGLLTLCQKMNDAAWREPEPESLRRGVMADGLATMFSGLVGTLGVNSAPSAVAVPAATGLASRRIAYSVAIIFALLAFIPFASVLLAAMPKPIIGGLAIYTGCFVLVNGLQTIAGVPLDQRRTIVVGFGIFGGLVPLAFPVVSATAPEWLVPILDSPLVLGTVSALLANAVLMLGNLGARLRPARHAGTDVPPMPVPAPAAAKSRV